MFPEKLKRARDLLGLTQSQAAKDSRVKQPHISDMEKNEKALIPKRYIDFLYSRGLDLNSLFDETAEVRLRPPEAAVPRIPAVDAILATNKHIQAVADAAVPELVRQLITQQQQTQERLARLEAAQKGATPPKGKKAG